MGWKRRPAGRAGAGVGASLAGGRGYHRPAMAEQLSDSWLAITIETRAASPGDPLGTACGVPSDEMRVVTIRPHGPRWLEVPLRSVLLG